MPSDENNSFQAYLKNFLAEAASDLLSMNGINSAKLSASLLMENLVYSMQTNLYIGVVVFVCSSVNLFSEFKS